VSGEWDSERESISKDLLVVWWILRFVLILLILLQFGTAGKLVDNCIS
jgi:uncharacterized membrane protein YvbJ